MDWTVDPVRLIIITALECLTRSLPLPVPYRFAARFFQEPGIKRSRQQIEDMHFLSLSAQVCQDYRGVFGELPNNLPAGAAGRRQCLGVGGVFQISKVPLAF